MVWDTSYFSLKRCIQKVSPYLMTEPLFRLSQELTINRFAFSILAVLNQQADM